MEGKNISCIQVSIFNSVDELKNEKGASDAFKAMYDICVKTGGNYNFFHFLLSLPSYKSYVYKMILEKFGWGPCTQSNMYGRNAMGYFSIRDYCSKKVGHCIVVVARRGIIVDIVGKYQMQLSEKILKLTGPDRRFKFISARYSGARCLTCFDKKTS